MRAIAKLQRSPGQSICDLICRRVAEQKSRNRVSRENISSEDLSGTSESEIDRCASNRRIEGENRADKEQTFLRL